MIQYNDLSKANVYLRDEFVGELEKVNRNKYTFKYDPKWIRSHNTGIGLSLPIKDEDYVSSNLFPFFDNLIPEGWLLSHAEKIFQIDKRNRFALLLATGRQTIGAVKVVAKDAQDDEIPLDKFILKKDKKTKKFQAEFLPAEDRCPYCLKTLTKRQLEGKGYHNTCATKMWGTTRKLNVCLDQIDPLNSFRQTIYGASISGAQRKGLFHLDDKAVLSSTYNMANYILKPKGDFEGLPENEHLTMAIAREIGFEIPPFTIFHLDEIGMVFAIKRFDITDKNEQLRMEDAAQVLERPSDDKYRSSYEKLGKAIDTHSDAPIIDKFELWKRVVFCFFVANGDMHLKNWSLLESDSLNGVFRLSPCYDLLNTRVPIHDESIDIGLALGGQKHQITKDMIVKFAEKLGVQSYIDEVFKELPRWMEIAEDFIKVSYLETDQKDRYLEIIKERFAVLTDQEGI